MKKSGLICVVLMMAIDLLTACGDDNRHGQVSKDVFADSLNAMVKYQSENDAEAAMQRIDSLETAGIISEAVANAQRTHICFDQQQYRMADFYGQKAIGDEQLHQQHWQLYHETCLYLISSALDNGDYKKALDLATSALDMARQENRPEARLYEARALTNIGIAQMRLTRVKEAARSCDEAYHIFERNLEGDYTWNAAYMWYRSVGETVQNFCICDIETALNWLPRMEMTYRKATETPDIPPSMKDYCLSKLELTKAEVYLKAGRQEEAAAHFKAYQQTEIGQSGEDWISPLLYYENTGQWGNALVIYEKWDSLCQANHMPMTTEYQEMLGMKYHALLSLHRNDQALHTATRIIGALKSVDSLSRSADASQLAIIYETQEKETQIAQQQAALSQQRLIGLAVALALITLFFVFYTLYRRRVARRMAEMKAQQERIESELRIARDIQMSMVPSTFPQRDTLDMYALMAPAREVGGDLYGYVQQGERLYFCVGDVSGKGVPASLFMAQATRLFRTLATQGLKPADICTQMNDALSGDDNQNGMFVTLFLGLIDLQTGHLDFCNAGHNPPFIGGDTDGGHFLEMEPNAPIGLWKDLVYEGEEIESITDRPLLIYTDGLNEAENMQQEQFGDDRLLRILRHTDFGSAHQVVESLASEVSLHRDGTEPNDDLTMMCIRITK